MRLREGHVLADRAIEQKRFLQHDAELRAVGAELHGRQVDAVHQDGAARRDVKGGNQADDGGFSRSGRADECGYGSRLGDEADVVQYFLGRFIGKADMFDFQETVDAMHRYGAAGGFVFRLLVEDFARALEAGDGFRDLRADGNDLKNRRDEKRQEGAVGKPLAGSHGSGKHLAAA